MRKLGYEHKPDDSTWTNVSGTGKHQPKELTLNYLPHRHDNPRACAEALAATVSKKQASDTVLVISPKVGEGMRPPTLSCIMPTLVNLARRPEAPQIFMAQYDTPRNETFLPPHGETFVDQLAKPLNAVDHAELNQYETEGVQKGNSMPLGASQYVGNLEGLYPVDDPGGHSEVLLKLLNKVFFS